MKASKEEFEQEIQINKDIMSFRKKFYVPEDEEEFWEELIKDANEIHNRYNSTFVDQMIMVNVDDIDRIMTQAAWMD